MEMIVISKSRWEELFKDCLARLEITRFKQATNVGGITASIEIVNDTYRKFQYEICQFKQQVEKAN